MKGLNPTQVKELMSKTRARGAYDPRLTEFLDSDEVGCEPAEEWPAEFGGKEATTLYQGFLNAAKKQGVQERVIVKQDDGHVYLLDKSKFEAIA